MIMYGAQNTNFVNVGINTRELKNVRYRRYQTTISNEVSSKVLKCNFASLCHDTGPKYKAI